MAVARSVGEPVEAVLLDPSPTTVSSPVEPLERTLEGASFVLFADTAGHDGPVVVAIEATDAGRAAARTARRLADDLGTNLVIVSVEPRGPRDRTAVAVRARRRARDRVAASARRATGDGRIQTLHGEAPREEQLLAFARECGARLVVAGTGGAGAWLAAGRTHGAPCPVVVVGSRSAEDQVSAPSSARA